MSDLEKRAEEFYERVVESSVRGLYTGPDIGLTMFVKALRTERRLAFEEVAKHFDGLYVSPETAAESEDKTWNWHVREAARSIRCAIEAEQEDVPR